MVKKLELNISLGFTPKPVPRADPPHHYQGTPQSKALSNPEFFHYAL